MISDGSCDTEDTEEVMATENVAVFSGKNNILKYIK